MFLLLIYFNALFLSFFFLICIVMAAVNLHLLILINIFPFLAGRSRIHGQIIINLEKQ